MSGVAVKYGVKLLKHPRKVIQFGPKTPPFLKKVPGYAYLAVHYGWALGQIFDEPSGYEGVVILEEDIEVAPDFYPYFAATAPLLYMDPTLLCVSAFNDNGQPQYASDAAAVYRSDFFPGRAAISHIININYLLIITH